MRTGNPVFKNFDSYGYGNSMVSDRASYGGMLSKTALSLLSVFVLSAFTYMFFPPLGGTAMLILVAIAYFATIAVVFFVSRQPLIKPWHIGLYAIFEGFILGFFTKIMEQMFPGIALQAIGATFVVALLTLVTYAVSGKRVGSKFARMVGIATGAMMLMYLVNFILALLHINTGLTNVGHNAGMLSYIISAVAVILATFNLVIDFDSARTMVEQGEGADVEWRAAFGITVTLVWLYMEILRILSYFRNS